MVKNIFLFLLIPAIAFGVELDTNGDGIIDSSYLPANIVNVPEVDGSVTNEIQVGDGVTITGTGTVADPFVAVGGGVETDPSFALWLSTFDPFEAADVPGAETDPAFNAWLIASPPLFAEVDPIFGLWDKSTGISITESQISDFGTYLTAETDPLSLKPTDIGVTVQAAGSYLTSESDPSVDSSAEIQSIIGAGVYEPIKGTDDNYVSDAEKALLVYLDDPSEATSEWQLTGASYSVTLNWQDRATTEDGYIIERKAGIAGTFAYIADVAENIETYVDTTGTLGQDYYYRVAAYTGLDPEAPDTQSGYSGTVKVTMSASTIPVISDTAYDATSWDANTDGATKNAIRDKIEGLPGGHDAVTLSALLDSNLFSLTTQELGLDTQTANYVFAGPASGAAAAPAFRALTADDIPALPYLAAEVDGSTTNEIEIQDEIFNATNFDGATATGVSQDDFYDRFHLFDADDDGVFTDETWFPSGGIDWTTDQGAVNIHSGNYTDTNTTYSAGTGMALDGTTFNCTVVDTNTTYAASDFDIKDLTDSTSLRSTWSGKQDALGFTPLNAANLRTTFQATPDDTHYPSEKLTKDSLDGKAASSHSHTGADLSGIDIGDDTNLAGTANEIVLTGDTLSLHADIARDSEIPRTCGFCVVIDGGGSEIADATEIQVVAPIAMTITSATALADVSGSIEVDIWKDTYANAPPTVADDITASAPVAISSATKSQDSTLTGWTTTVSAGDVLIFHVNSCTTIERATICIGGTR